MVLTDPCMKEELNAIKTFDKIKKTVLHRMLKDDMCVSCDQICLYFTFNHFSRKNEKLQNINIFAC